MKKSSRCHRVLSVLLCTVLATPLQVAGFANRAHADGRALIRDQALGADGELSGIVVDHEHQPLSGVSVRLRNNDAVVAQTRTDASGRFALRTRRGGVYLVEANGSAQLLRLWTNEAAPPAARRTSLTLVTDSEMATVRGQNPGPGMSPDGHGPWLTPYRGAWIGLIALGGLIAIVASNDDDGS